MLWDKYLTITYNINIINTKYRVLSHIRLKLELKLMKKLINEFKEYIFQCIINAFYVMDLIYYKVG